MGLDEIRRRHANAIKNTATGRALELALQEIERLRGVITELVAGCEREMDDTTQGPSETCCKMWERIEAARVAGGV